MDDLALGRVSRSAAGTWREYEQEVSVTLHPPRAAEAEARTADPHRRRLESQQRAGRLCDRGSRDRTITS